MTDPSFALRSAPSGPVLVGTPGNVLAFDASGRTVSGIPLAAGGLTSFNARTAPAVIPTAGDYDAGEVTNNAATVSGASVAAALDNVNVGFRATYYVDPAFTGLSTGSAASPYKTIAAAFAAAAALAVAAGIIYLAPNNALTENVVFPLTGNWEIASQQRFGFQTAVITGTVDLSCSGTAQRSLTNLNVTGAVSGNVGSAGPARLAITGCFLTTLTLTGTAAATWRVALFAGAGPQATGLGGLFTGAVNVRGTVSGLSYRFVSSVSFSNSISPNVFTNCDFAGPFLSDTAGQNTLILLGCVNYQNAPQQVTATTGTVNLQLDGASAAALMLGPGLATTGTVNVRTLNSNGAPVRNTATGNVAATALSQQYPASFMVAEAALTIKTPGTAGSAVLNVIYTDATGALQTKPVATIADITSAAGTEAHGTIPFEQNGATTVKYSITGVVTPGALSLAVSVSVRQAG